jgi:hypothetical protein
MVKMINKTYIDAHLELKIVEPTGAQIRNVGNDILIHAESKYDGQFFIDLPNDERTGHKTRIVIDVYKNGEKIDRVKTNFLGPIY